MPERADLVVIDVSFISLRLVLPALPPLAKPGAPVVALVKPQFEVGREDVGRAASCATRRRGRAPRRGARGGGGAGLRVGAETVSPITGGKGNIEFLLFSSSSAGGHVVSNDEWGGEPDMELGTILDVVTLGVVSVGGYLVSVAKGGIEATVKPPSKRA